jgi:predicted NBD/HSP70 family sugar kinase
VRWYLGIEIGGTKLQIAVGRGEGEPCRAFWRGQVEASQRAVRIQQQIVEGVDELLARARLDRAQIAGVAVGFGGPVDTRRGLIVTSHQVAGWENFPLVKWFDVNFGWPAVLHNDADTAAFAEARFGAGKGFDPVLYVTVGSGIGGGLICGGKIFRGSGAGAMEIGHLRPGNAPYRRPGRRLRRSPLVSGSKTEPGRRLPNGKKPRCSWKAGLPPRVIRRSRASRHRCRSAADTPSVFRH